MPTLQEKHALLMQHLLPPGSAYPRDTDSVLFKLLQGLSDELDRIDLAAQENMADVYPDVEGQFLVDWERAYSLPEAGPWRLAQMPFQANIGRAGDPLVCWEEYPGLSEPAPFSTFERVRNLLEGRMRVYGGSNPEYFIELAHALGHVDAEITEFTPFYCGYSRAGDPIYDLRWLFTWVLQLSGIHYTYFRAGSSCGDRLIRWDVPLGIQFIEHYKPAHTFLRWGPTDGFISDGALYLSDDAGNLLIA